MDSADKSMCRERYRRLIARNAAATRTANIRRNRNRHALEMPESDDDGVLMVVGQAARRKLARKQRRRAVLRGMQEKAARGQIGVGRGSEEDPVDLDGTDDDEIQGAIQFGRQGGEPEVVVRAGGRGNANGGEGASGGYRELRADELAGNDPFFVA
jgi:hypothetical protein